MHVVNVVALLSLLARTSAQETLGRLRKANVFLIESPIEEDTQVSNDFLGLDDEMMFRGLFELSSYSFSMSMSMSMSMDTCTCSNDCLPSDAMPFDTEGSVDIGDTGIEGETTRCGPNCYKLKGSGQDVCRTEDFSSFTDGPDALHFAYTKVTGPFVLASKVCGSDTIGSFESTAPRTGLMVRESLDPLAQNFFVSHTPDAEANWSARRDTNGESSCNFDGSPDVPCLYLVIERFAPGDGDFELIGYYSYEVDFLDGVDTCSKRETIFEIGFNGFSFPEEVYVGMAVLYGKENALYESQFNEIHFADENSFRDMPFVTRIPI